MEREIDSNWLIDRAKNIFLAGSRKEARAFPGIL